jgi:cell growth-regulating nucleolar protein
MSPLTQVQSCISEAQKYQGALYREKKAKPAPSGNNQAAQNAMAHAAYVEDVAEDYDSWREYEQHSDDDGHSPNPPPEAPTPPSAAEPVNVFDFLVSNPTPTASSLSLPATAPIQHNEETALVRFDPEANGLDSALDDDSAMVQYGSGPVPVSQFETPAPKPARRKVKDGDKEAKKDKKRKRLHIETDHIMTDAPPVLHSGLTGGINRLMSRPNVFPPSPDYSGSGDAAETPASPLKKAKSKHHKSSRTESLGNSLMAMISSGSKPKSSSSKKRTKTKSSSSSSKKKKRTTTAGAKSLEGPKEQKLLEFRPGSKDGETAAAAGREMVVYKPRAEHFLSFVNKGPDSERGCSVNKALKRYHRERNASGVSLSKLMEEKELFRSLRMKKNDRGEVVLFCISD